MKLENGHFDYFKFNDNFIIVLCDEEDNIVAFCGIRNRNEIAGLMVKPEYRGTGVVHAIMGEVLRTIYSWGSDFAWFTFFPRQRKFYERFGAKVVPVIRPDGKLTGIYPFPSREEASETTVG